MAAYLIDFLEDESGAGLMEYALVAAFVSVLIVGSLSTVGSNTSAAITMTSNDVDQAAYETCIKTAKTPHACRYP